MNRHIMITSCYWLRREDVVEGGTGTIHAKVKQGGKK